MALYGNVLDTIGNTPIIKINKLAPKHVNLYVKVEARNPMGSVKDRMARAVIEAAEGSGDLKPGQTVIEATSGNTGIGLAMVCAQKGYPLVVVMAENFSIERRKMLRFLGARVVLTPAADKGSGMLAKAEELAQAHGYYLCRQFDNEANADVHTSTTAAEILTDFAGQTLHYFVTGFGTGGTLKGVARGLRAGSPETRIIAAEPDNAQVLGSGTPQPRDGAGKPKGSHPGFRPHLMQGWSPDFISGLTESAVAAGYVDGIEPVSGEFAMTCARRLAREEGIFVGTSSGATLAAALAIAERAAEGSNIVCMLPDTAERYLSTPLFADIEAEMNDAEQSLSRSTPGYRFDGAQPALVATPQLAQTDPAIERRVTEILKNNAVVMFSLEWCEFCWSVRKLFARAGIHYESVDLDSVAYQQGDLGGRIRSVLANRTGQVTIPQIFIGAEHIGGCTETFDEFKQGRLHERLEAAGEEFDRDCRIDPYTLLPSWLHTRNVA